MKQLHLLPHKWQKIGFVGIVVCIILVVFLWKGIYQGLFPGYFEEWNRDLLLSQNLGAIVLNLLLPLFLIIMAFSEEKTEDERTVELRHQSLIRSVIVFFVLYVLYWIATFQVFPRIHDVKVRVVSERLISFVKSFGALVVYYLCIFKLCVHGSLKQLRLLPHKWQKISLFGIAACIVLAIFMWKGIHKDLYAGYWGLEEYTPDYVFGQFFGLADLFVALPLFLVLMALSKERVEDERITGLRHQSLVQAVIVYCVICVVCWLSGQLFSHQVPDEEKAHIWQGALTVVKSFAAFVVYYLCIFRINIIRQNKEYEDEE